MLRVTRRKTEFKDLEHLKCLVFLKKTQAQKTLYLLRGVLDRPCQTFFSVIFGGMKSKTAKTSRKLTPSNPKFNASPPLPYLENKREVIT